MVLMEDLNWNNLSLLWLSKSISDYWQLIQDIQEIFNARTTKEVT